MDSSSHSSLGKRIQVEDVEAEPVIIGGMVLDINATPSITANPRTTTPGKVLFTLGGVARNVAECVSKLGTKPYMISVVGLDMAGNLLLEHWKSTGLSIEGIQRCNKIETAVVCNIFDAKGELAAAVASVEAIEKFLTPEWIRNFKSNISSAPVLMIDANLSHPALEAACQMAAEYSIPVWFEPVSVTKSKRIVSVAKYITFASPNEDELIAIANAVSCGGVFHPIQIDTRIKYSPESLFRMLEPAIAVVLKKDDESTTLFAVHYPALSASVVRLTGAGDCLVGGALASICAGLDVMQSVAVGIAASKATIEGETNVPTEYSLARIADDARSVYLGAKVVFCQSML